MNNGSNNKESGYRNENNKKNDEDQDKNLNMRDGVFGFRGDVTADKDDDNDKISNNRLIKSDNVEEKDTQRMGKKEEINNGRNKESENKKHGLEENNIKMWEENGRNFKDELDALKAKLEDKKCNSQDTCERDNILNNYIAILDSSKCKHNGGKSNNDEKNSHIDSFEKAEIEHKMRSKEKKSKQQNMWQSNSLTNMNLKMFKKDDLHLPLMYKQPEKIYIREVKKQKSTFELYHKLFQQKAEEEKKKFKAIEKREKIDLKNKKDTRAKQQKLLKESRNPSNPYSNQWTDKILRTRYQSYIKVNGFLNGIPKFEIKHWKPEPKYKAMLINNSRNLKPSLSQAWYKNEYFPKTNLYHNQAPLYLPIMETKGLG